MECLNVELIVHPVKPQKYSQPTTWSVEVNVFAVFDRSNASGNDVRVFRTLVPQWLVL
jgi:hypothetical protein